MAQCYYCDRNIPEDRVEKSLYYTSPNEEAGVYNPRHYFVCEHCSYTNRWVLCLGYATALGIVYCILSALHIGRLIRESLFH